MKDVATQYRGSTKSITAAQFLLRLVAAEDFVALDNSRSNPLDLSGAMY